MADIVADQDAALAETGPTGGVVMVTGAGASVTVSLGHLAVEDGIGPTRRSRRFARVTPPAARLSRVVVEASSGMVSLDALAWCRAVDVVVVGLDRDGEPAWATLPDGPRDARLTRALALAGYVAGSVDESTAGAPSDWTRVGLAIVCGVLRAKLAGQWDVAGRVLGCPAAADTVASLMAGLELVGSVDEARQLEASAAAVYFDAWAGHKACVPTFARRDVGRVPVSWAVYPGRRSELGAGASNRRASHPTNAILNYLFTLVRSEAAIALLRLGLDPSLGVLHADMARRDSLACDLAEVARPSVESYVLDLLAQRSFRRADFIEGPKGEVRLGMSLRQELAGTVSRWATAVAPHAEAIRNTLARAVRDGASRSIAAETAPLTGTRRKQAAGAAARRAKEARAADGRRAVADGHRAAMAAVRPAGRPPRPTLWRCPDCGGQVDNPRHVRCSGCQAKDPRQAPEVRSRRGQAIAARRRAQAAWDGGGGAGAFDPEAWSAILGGLADVKLADIQAAAGISKGFASQVRAGKFRPHPSTWPALAELAGIELARAQVDRAGDRGDKDGQLRAHPGTMIGEGGQQ